MISRISPPEQSVGGGGWLTLAIAFRGCHARGVIWPLAARAGRVAGAIAWPTRAAAVVALCAVAGRPFCQVALQRGDTRQARMWMAVLGPVILLLLIWWGIRPPASPCGTLALKPLPAVANCAARGTAGGHRLGVAAGLWLLRGDGCRPPGRPCQYRERLRHRQRGLPCSCWAARRGQHAAAGGTQAWLVIFVLAGMAALAVASIERSFMPAAPKRRCVCASTYWLASVGLIMAVVVLTGLLLGALVAPIP